MFVAYLFIISELLMWKIEEETETPRLSGDGVSSTTIFMNCIISMNLKIISTTIYMLVTNFWFIVNVTTLI